jgi:hypothetical protein
LNAAARLELPEPAFAGGAAWVVVPEPAAPEPAVPEPVGRPAGGVTPCCCRQAAKPDRLLLELVGAEAEAALALLLVEVELAALLPQAASAQLEITAATAREARRPRRWVRVEVLMTLSFADLGLRMQGVAEAESQAPLAEPELELAEAPVAELPESLTELATSVPLELFAPWMTTVSPG